MNVRQLRDYLDRLVAADCGTLPICVGEQDSSDDRVTVIEIDGAKMVTGTFQEDPAPKMPGSNPSTGAVVLLTGWRQDFFDALDAQGGKINELPATPVKIQTRPQGAAQAAQLKPIGPGAQA
jgi:hypothetical protein